MAKRKGGYRSVVNVSVIANLTEPVGSGECAALHMYYTRIGKAAGWVEGEKVKGHETIKRGTAIATFVNGKYPNILQQRRS